MLHFGSLSQLVFNMWTEGLDICNYTPSFYLFYENKYTEIVLALFWEIVQGGWSHINCPQVIKFIHCSVFVLLFINLMIT